MAKSRSAQSSSDASIGAGGAALEASSQARMDASGSASQSNFARSESNLKQNTVNERKSRSVTKKETMLSEMTIKVRLSEDINFHKYKNDVKKHLVT